MAACGFFCGVGRLVAAFCLKLGVHGRICRGANETELRGTSVPRLEFGSEGKVVVIGYFD
jgi:hypothetical protein